MVYELYACGNDSFVKFGENTGKGPKSIISEILKKQSLRCTCPRFKHPEIQLLRVLAFPRCLDLGAPFSPASPTINRCQFGNNRCRTAVASWVFRNVSKYFCEIYAPDHPTRFHDPFAAFESRKLCNPAIKSVDIDPERYRRSL